MTKTMREEFEKEFPLTFFNDDFDCYRGEMRDKLWNWHLSQQKKLLEEILEYGKDPETGLFDSSIVLRTVIFKIANLEKPSKILIS